MEEQRRARRNLAQNIIITLLSVLAVVLLAQHYNVSVDYLVGLTDETAPSPRKRQPK